jgi:RNA polymerase sigma-70 factor (ECF subfamily)
VTPTTTREVADAYVDLRPLLFSLAYRMLSSVSEAEDIVQEAFVRYQRSLADGTTVESPKAYLSAVVTRLAIDHLKSARVRREAYVGEWLPEPTVGCRSYPRFTNWPPFEASRSSRCPRTRPAI